MSKCLVIGSSVCDCLIYTDVLPSREGDAHISNQKMQIGGCALNVAVTLK
ncbi:carbohydrate kinase family protein [Enterococcus cecorum]|nr:carbohydrate kinase family protein [Enterococcus cecorum]